MKLKFLILLYSKFNIKINAIINEFQFYYGFYHIITLNYRLLKWNNIFNVLWIIFCVLELLYSLIIHLIHRNIWILNMKWFLEVILTIFNIKCYLGFFIATWPLPGSKVLYFNTIIIIIIIIIINYYYCYKVIFEDYQPDCEIFSEKFLILEKLEK